MIFLMPTSSGQAAMRVREMPWSWPPKWRPANKGTVCKIPRARTGGLTVRVDWIAQICGGLNPPRHDVDQARMEVDSTHGRSLMAHRCTFMREAE